MEIVIILILIAINGFFALSEIAFVSSRRDLIESERERGHRHAAKVLGMMDEPDRFLSSIQVGITLVGIISGAYGGIALADDFAAVIARIGLPPAVTYDISLVLVVGAITYLSIVLGELVPKAIGLRNPEKVILTVIPAVRFFSILTSPLVTLLSVSTRMTLRIFGFTLSGIDYSDDPFAEILGIARSAAVRNKISREQESIIANTALLRSTKLSEIMVELTEVKMLITDMSLEEALVASHVHHHTRFPLAESSTGEIVGYINFKDIVTALRINPANASLYGIRRPMISFQENDPIDLALRRLIATRQHIALVRTLEGLPLGMVTLEDILETIVGDIDDEYDVVPDHLYEISPGRYIAGGGVAMKRLRQVLGGTFPEDERTVASWLRERCGPDLRAGMTVTYEGYMFIVRKVSRTRIHEVIVDRRSAP